MNNNEHEIDDFQPRVKLKKTKVESENYIYIYI